MAPKEEFIKKHPQLKTKKNKLQQKNILALDLKGKRKSKGKKKSQIQLNESLSLAQFIHR